MTTLAVSVTGIARRIGELDRVWLALGFAFLFGLVIAPRLAGETLWFVGQSLLSVAPFLALAVATAAGAKASGAENLITTEVAIGKSIRVVEVLVTHMLIKAAATIKPPTIDARCSRRAPN